MQNAAAQNIRIDVWFDLICPWCWIGKRHLKDALASFNERHPDVGVEVHWHSVQLIPDVPPQGWPYKLFYEHRLGGPAAVRARQAQVQQAAARAGLHIHYDRLSVFPNTWQAHRLLSLAQQQLPPDPLDALLDDLFKAYFQEGCNLGDVIALNTLAKAHGLDLSHIEELETSATWALPANLSGVPFFVFDQTHALSGAQPPEALTSAMEACLLRPSENALQ